MEPPKTPEKSDERVTLDLGPHLHKQLATPAPSSPNVPRTPEHQTSPRVLSTPKSQRTTRVPLTPGSKLYLPVSPSSARAWQSAKATRSGSSTSLSVNAHIPPMPLPTWFLSAEEAESLPEEELRPNLVKAIDAIESYEAHAKQFRGLANHYLLQSKLQSFETHESAQRHEVERDISKREIERLVLEFVGHNEQTLDTESIRRRLKKTRQRLRDLETLCNEKDKEIIELRAELKVQQSLPQLHTMNTSPKRPERPHIQGPHLDPPQAVFSPLELLATQVLTDRIQHRRSASSSSTISATSDDEMK